jgi:hypothetical protein
MSKRQRAAILAEAQRQEDAANDRVRDPVFARTLDAAREVMASGVSAGVHENLCRCATVEGLALAIGFVLGRHFRHSSHKQAFRVIWEKVQEGVGRGRRDNASWAAKDDAAAKQKAMADLLNAPPAGSA